MSELAFDRTIINPRERPLSQDINSAQAQLDRSLREVLAAMLARRTAAANDVAASPTGFFGDGFKVRANSPASMVVDVTAGIGLMPNTSQTSDIDGILGLDDQASSSPIYLSATQEFTVPTAPTAGNARWDIIMAKATPEVGDPTSRDVLNGSGVFAAQLVNKTLKFDVLGEVETIAAAATPTAALVYKYGVSAVAGSEVEPATDAGYVKIAGIRVGASVTAIEANKIIDNRRFLAPGGVLSCGFELRFAGGGTLGEAPAAVAAAMPPGVEWTVARAYPGSFNVYALYVKAGGAQEADSVVRTVSNGKAVGAGAGSWVWRPVNDGIGLGVLNEERTVVVDAALQAYLAGANAYVALPVAIGQRLYQVLVEDFTWYSTTPGSAVTATSNLAAPSGNVGVNFQIVQNG